MFKYFILAGLGSFIGGGFRYLVQHYVSRLFTETFPYGTLAVNVIGCFLIGIIFSFSEKADIMSAPVRIFLATGICGGFTTFSSFSIEVFQMLRDGQFFHVFAYTGLSVLIGVFATFLGVFLFKIL
jgi:fluoride exporter